MYIYSGMAKEAGTGRPLSVAELTVNPVAACGNVKGGCQVRGGCVCVCVCVCVRVRVYACV